MKKSFQANKELLYSQPSSTNSPKTGFLQKGSWSRNEEKDEKVLMLILALPFTASVAGSPFS